MRQVPGDPALVLLGPTATAGEVDAARRRLGLNASVITQYWLYLKRVATVDFATSFTTDGSAAHLLVTRIPATLELVSAAMIVGLVVGFPLGILAAYRRGKWQDGMISGASLVGQSLPPFWVGIMAILLFSRYLKLLPSGGSGGLDHLVMPALVLALPFMSIVMRLVRSGMLEVMNQNYIRTARAKGLPGRKVLSGHGIKNILIPVVTVVGLQVGFLLSGTVIIETVFAWPGIGSLLVQGIENRDYPVVQVTVLFIAIAFIMTNLFVDLLYGVIDPRIRSAQ
jgi:peptide/nickel transport system permease protein